MHEILGRRLLRICRRWDGFGRRFVGLPIRLDVELGVLVPPGADVLEWVSVAHN
jgi:hypothetical protein